MTCEEMFHNSMISRSKLGPFFYDFSSCLKCWIFTTVFCPDMGPNTKLLRWVDKRIIVVNENTNNSSFLVKLFYGSVYGRSNLGTKKINCQIILCQCIWKITLWHKEDKLSFCMYYLQNLMFWLNQNLVLHNIR